MIGLCPNGDSRPDGAPARLANCEDERTSTDKLALAPGAGRGAGRLAASTEAGRSVARPDLRSNGGPRPQPVDALPELHDVQEDLQRRAWSAR